MLRYDLTIDQNLTSSPADNAVITIVDGFVHTVDSIYGNTTNINAPICCNAYAAWM